MLLGCEVLTRKGLQRTALASFHTLSMQLYYIFALRSVGTVTKNVRQSLWEGEGNLKWIFEMRGGGGWNYEGFPSAMLKKINWIPRTDFYLARCYTAFVSDTVSDISSFPFQDGNHGVCFTYSTATSERPTWERQHVFFTARSRFTPYSTCRSSVFTSSEHKTWHLHSASPVLGRRPSSCSRCVNCSDSMKIHSLPL